MTPILFPRLRDRLPYLKARYEMVSWLMAIITASLFLKLIKLVIIFMINNTFLQITRYVYAREPVANTNS